MNRIDWFANPNASRALPCLASSLQKQVARSVDPTLPAGRDERGGVFLLDDGWAGKPVANAQCRAVVNAGLSDALPIRQQDVRSAHACWPAGRRPGIMLALAARHAVHRAQVDQTDWRLGCV